uniref:NAD(P)-binding domain-containing protein n=1 Tax=Arsenophonus endosymbiont of Trialeurodes vaporariorum TaxID=235567 RepID=A0A3B0M3K6_9GAMM
MSQWIVFGAGKGIGYHLVQYGLQQGHQVIAFIRHAKYKTRLTQIGAQVIEGDACQYSDIKNTLADISNNSIIFSTIGGKSADLTGNLNIIKSAEMLNMRRLLLVTSVGCSDGWKYLSSKAKALFGMSIRHKSMVECYLKTSSLDYTILRPAGLLNLPATGNHQRIQLPQIGLVTRQDIAIELSNIAENKLTYQQTYTVIDPSLSFNMK